MAPANVADEPRACPQRGGVSPPNNRPWTQGVRPTVGGPVGRHYSGLLSVRRRRQTRRIEPPGRTLYRAHGCPTSGGSSATLAGSR
jgi:hypothetical protein